jgi:hypothetical protein
VQGDEFGVAQDLACSLFGEFYFGDDFGAERPCQLGRMSARRRRFERGKVRGGPVRPEDYKLGGWKDRGRRLSDRRQERGRKQIVHSKGDRGLLLFRISGLTFEMGIRAR